MEVLRTELFCVWNHTQETYQHETSIKTLIAYVCLYCIDRVCHNENLGEIADREFKNTFYKNVFLLNKFYFFYEILSAFLRSILYSVCIFGKCISLKMKLVQPQQANTTVTFLEIFLHLHLEI